MSDPEITSKLPKPVPKDQHEVCLEERASDSVALSVVGPDDTMVAISWPLGNGAISLRRDYSNGFVGEGGLYPLDRRNGPILCSSLEN